ncbi:MAG TPA: hypothetical protein DG048_08840, partial [Pseudoalteromonas sp.]|nr:hypothetical protein [Pseudoalteromonas sp.]
MTDYSNARQSLVSWVKDTLTGNVLKDNTLWESNPFNCYTTGILYPVGTVYESDDDEQSEDDDSEASMASGAKRVRYQPPSSMGFSFYVDQSTQSIRVFYSGFSFTKAGKQSNRQAWEKNSLVPDEGEEIEIALAESSRFTVMNSRALVDVKIRPHGTGKIVTVSLSNISSQPKEEKESERDATAKNSIFQAELKCFISSDSLKDYPRVSHALLSEEEQELELRYKDERVYAIGHGVAVDWRVGEKTTEFFSDFMPTVEVPQVTANAGKANKVLSFSFLKSIESDRSVFNQLSDFIDNYEDWIDRQIELAETGTSEEVKVAKRIVERMEEAKQRMRSGV